MVRNRKDVKMKFRWSVVYRVPATKDRADRWELWCGDDGFPLTYASTVSATGMAQRIGHAKSILVGSEQFSRAYFNTFGRKHEGAK